MASDPWPAAALADLFDLVLPDMPEVLVDAAASTRLRRVADALPLLPAAGVEVRLESGVAAVDLQQGVQAERAPGAAGLGGLRRRLGDASPSAGWSRALELCDRWLTPGDALHEGISELWFEYDVPVDLGDRELRLAELAPSAFALLRRDDDATTLAAAGAALDALRPGDEAGQAILRRFAQALPDPAWVSHVGAMLGREPAAVRLHVSRLAVRDTAAFLADVAWPGDVEPVVALAERLLAFADDVVVCFDVVDGVLLPRLGLEAFFKLKSGLDPRWPLLLDDLVGQGLVDGAKVAALCGWPGTVSPRDHRAVWPDALVLADLQGDAESFELVERRLSHVKLTWSPGAPTTAKGYFGWGRVRREPSPQESSLPNEAPRAPASSIPAATGAAVEHLLRTRGQDGLWRDFYDRLKPRDAERRLRTWASDEWVSGYVGAALAGVRDARANAAAREALRVVLGRRGPASGWGYNLLTPQDADSTGAVLRLARALGTQPTERLAAALGVIAAHVDDDGGVATFLPQAGAELLPILSVAGRADGWCRPHVCVTAAVAVLDLGTGPLARLRREQRPDGSWQGYWWHDDEYTTARAVEALAAAGGHEREVDLAVRWAAARVGREGAVLSRASGEASPFATALALQAIALGAISLDQPMPAAAKRAARWLMDQQGADGSWKPSAWLIAPSPDDVPREELLDARWTYVDDDGLFTTATGLSALTAYAEAGGA